MSSKRIAVDTASKKGQLFKVSEYGGRFYVYKVTVGFFSDDLNQLGESRSLEDAIQIIKAFAGGSVRDIRISGW